MSYIDSDLWQPKTPIDVFFFDWDGTLSLIEGVDLLATMNGVAQHVHEITQRCMSTAGLTVADYRRRLDFIKPSQEQIKQLAKQYDTHCAPGARAVINLLNHLGKKIYIISAGIKSAILPLAEQLGIPESRILAVDVYFNVDGRYEGFDEHSDLVKPKGKSLQISKILNAKEHSLLLGDGYTDWEAQTSVTRFVGYAGASPKTWVQEHSYFYIQHSNLLPVLALGLTHEEQLALTGEFRAYYEQGLSDLQKGLVLVKEP
ncbi:HAD-IB family phosphatase [Legionella fallonii]|uniref:phosphoserine phosphatase n=1 Tax=Legionella fallonii LLAP-10 TaxID=1212491 RepID=A0A098G8R6_9GAMM|nr:HAD-IB family phosphatase [Legionella fallonii]CEG58884.1 putative phosphoserine phosphatase [Legionella fallonii LLAP-10]